MAYRSDREQGQPSERPRRDSLLSSLGPSSRIPSGPAASNTAASTGRTEVCTRPTARLSILCLQRGSHPQKSFGCGSGNVLCWSIAAASFGANQWQLWRSAIPKGDRRKSTRYRRSAVLRPRLRTIECSQHINRNCGAGRRIVLLPGGRLAISDQFQSLIGHAQLPIVFGCRSGNRPCAREAQPLSTDSER